MTILYLLSIVTANITVHIFGEFAIYINSLVLIGLDLSLRDRLHNEWKGEKLKLKMVLLVMSGTVLTAIINKDFYLVALASCVAFSASFSVDFLVYDKLDGSPMVKRVNYSNVASALVDSVVFPSILFGEIVLHITIIQFSCKIVGGYLWAKVLLKY